MDHDFGKLLQKARTDRGLSLEEAAGAVRIRSTFLRALENGDLTKFPNAAYAKSFLLMYGKFLGVNLKDVAANIDTTTQMKVEGYQYLTNRATAQPKSKPEPELTFSAAPPQKSNGSWLPLLVLGGTVVGVVVAFVIWSNMNRLSDGPATAPAKNPPPAATVEKISPQTPAPQQQPATKQPPTPPAIITTPETGATATPADGEIPRARAVSPVARIAATDSDALAEIGVPKPRIISTGTVATPPPAPSVPIEEESSAAANPDATVIESKRKTWVVIRTGPGGQALFEDYVYPGAKPLRLPKGRYFIELKDAEAVEITRNGRRVGYSSPGILLE
ncbi:MAG: helix-turn-helix domain-containing protein [Chthoniobacteraceae bacterium]